MQHFDKEIGAKRICPETGNIFINCWCNIYKYPVYPYNECDQCNGKYETISGLVRRLNKEKNRGIIPCHKEPKKL